MSAVNTRAKTFAAALAAAIAAGTAAAQGHPTPGAGYGPQTGVRYATDAFPGFDSEKNIVSPTRKTPRWISFLYGPSKACAKEQLALDRKSVV